MDRPSSDRKHALISALLFLIALVYVSAFWGEFAGLFGETISRWSHILDRHIAPAWREHCFTSLDPGRRSILLYLVTAVVFALIVPAIVLRLCGRSVWDVGLGLPNRAGRNMLLLAVVLSVPFGFFLQQSWPTFHTTGMLVFWTVTAHAAMIPEHFLICGTVTAILLERRRLPREQPFSPVEGSPALRFLRRLGLAQQGRGILAWFGLNRTSLAAIVLSGFLFGAIHIGKDNPWEIFLSFPGGVTVAYMTLRSGSIWPAILAHWAMNLIPAAIQWLMP